MGDEDDSVATVQWYIEVLRQGRPQHDAAAFAIQSSILDGMAPHLWVVPTASRDWYRDVLLKERDMARQSTALLSTSPATLTLPATPRTWSCLQP
jgi:hypothetical protein